MNLDDKSLFLDAMEDVQPLKRNNDVHWHRERNVRAPQRIDTLQLDNYLTTGYLDIVPLAVPLEFKRERAAKRSAGKTAARKIQPAGKPVAPAPAGRTVSANAVRLRDTGAKRGAA
ncbi:Probable DNA endonuclease SmrA [Klebsiella aerogenes]|nr:Probable DNA endonuclease SmrA [Klebsiella aerogenes]